MNPGDLIQQEQARRKYGPKGTRPTPAGPMEALTMPPPPHSPFPESGGAERFAGSGPRPEGIPLNLSAEYRNQYGTKFGVRGNPLTRDVGVNANVPLGDHQRGLSLQGNAEWNPGQGFSAGIGISKRNMPKPPSAEEINAGLDPSIRDALRQHPDALQALIKARQRETVDREAGIGVPGSEKYSFNVGLNEDGYKRRNPRSMGAPPYGPQEPYRDADPFHGVIPAGYRR